MPAKPTKYTRIKEEILKRADIVSVIERYVSLKKTGTSYMGLCPFHNEKTPSFSVNPNSADGGYFNCFGCHKGGGVIDFVMEKEGMSFVEALKTLASEYGVMWDLNEEADERDGYANESGSSRAQLLKATEFASKFFYEEMTKSDIAKNYFKSRGISGETAKEFRLGYAPDYYDRLLKAAKNAGFSENLLIETALARKNDWGVFDFFRNRVIFPIFDNAGRAVAFGGRAMGDEKPKYLNSSNTPLYDKSRIFYGYFQTQKEIRLHKTAILVEGYMDMIMLYQNGIKNALAPCGTSFSQEHALAVSRVAQKVFVALDGDEAGINGAKKVVEKLLPLEIDVRHVLFPDAQDPDTFVQKNGKSGFEELLKNAQDGFSFYLKRIEKEHDTASAVGKSKALKDALNLLSQMKNEIILSDFITKISTRWKIEVAEIKRAIYGFAKDKNMDVGVLQADDSGAGGDFKRIFYTEEGKILQLFFWYPQILADPIFDLDDNFFSEALANKLYYLMKNEKIEKNSFLNDPDLGGREKAFLLLLSEEEPSENEEEAKISAAAKIDKFRVICLQNENAGLRNEIREESDEKRRKILFDELNENLKKIAILQKRKMRRL